MTLNSKALQNMFEMIGSDAQIMAELVQSFLDETPLLVEKMNAACNAQNQMDIGRAAHTLKSTARDFGAEDVANLCQVLEASCGRGFPENAGSQINSIAQCLKAKQIELAAYKTTLAIGG